VSTGNIQPPAFQAQLKIPDCPPRYSVIGVPVSKTDYADAVNFLISAARKRQAALATAFAVHGVVEATRNAELCRRISAFDIVTPDGQPVRHALNILYGAQLRDRVYGPTLMLKLCESAVKYNIGIYLYGSTRKTVESLKRSLEDRYPSLRVVGAEPSIFRPLTHDESLAFAERVERSGAAIVFIGLGCPRQEHFAFEHRDLVRQVMVCVGAAFDFHAGNKRQAPAWMQANSLEWLFRLSQEPRRLFRRYAVTNFLFLWSVSLQYSQIFIRRRYG
jgi:exopolysaccharide biosynthesis WecB/TagA/CpsF family protein